MPQWINSLWSVARLLAISVLGFALANVAYLRPYREASGDTRTMLLVCFLLAFAATIAVLFPVFVKVMAGYRARFADATAVDLATIAMTLLFCAIVASLPLLLAIRMWWWPPTNGAHMIAISALVGWGMAVSGPYIVPYMSRKSTK